MFKWGPGRGFWPELKRLIGKGGKGEGRKDGRREQEKVEELEGQEMDRKGQGWANVLFKRT